MCWIGQHVRVPAHRKQVDVDAKDFVGMRITETRRGKPTPVAALYGEPRIPQPGHQIGQTISHFLDAETLLPRFERQTVARQRRRDDSECIRRIATETRRIGQPRNQIEELVHRARPTVHQQQRIGVWTFAR